MAIQLTGGKGQRILRAVDRVVMVQMGIVTVIHLLHLRVVEVVEQEETTKVVALEVMDELSLPMTVNFL